MQSASKRIRPEQGSAGEFRIESIRCWRSGHTDGRRSSAGICARVWTAPQASQVLHPAKPYVEKMFGLAAERLHNRQIPTHSKHLYEGPQVPHSWNNQAPRWTRTKNNPQTNGKPTNPLALFPHWSSNRHSHLKYDRGLPPMLQMGR